MKVRVAGSKVAPAGTTAALNAIASLSTSLPLTVKVTVLPTVTRLFPIGFNTGALFTSVTVIVIVAVVAGTLPSLTVKVIG